MPLRRVLICFFCLAFIILAGTPVFAQKERGGGEAHLVLPDLSQVNFLGGINGQSLLMGGLVIAALGLVFGLVIYTRLRDMPVHASMKEISELIYETCKTYLLTQGRFLFPYTTLSRSPICSLRDASSCSLKSLSARQSCFISVSSSTSTRSGSLSSWFSA